MVVQDAYTFHKQNYNLHCEDYQGLSYLLGADFIMQANSKIFPAHFNHISLGKINIKYCIVAKKDFLNDLLYWNILSFAGRCHKSLHIFY